LATTPPAVLQEGAQAAASARSGATEPARRTWGLAAAGGRIVRLAATLRAALALAAGRQLPQLLQHVAVARVDARALPLVAQAVGAALPAGSAGHLHARAEPPAARR
jgi:hypothetical protein